MQEEPEGAQAGEKPAANSIADSSKGLDVKGIADMHATVQEMTAGLAQELQTIREEMNRMQMSIGSDLEHKVKELQDGAKQLERRRGGNRANTSNRATRGQQQHMQGQNRREPRNKTGFLDTQALVAIILLIIVVGPGWPILVDFHNSVMVAMYGDQGYSDQDYD